jgi:hypothetical protein
MRRQRAQEDHQGVHQGGAHSAHGNTMKLIKMKFIVASYSVKLNS